MENIWGLFLQTVTVSAAAALLLLLKKLMAGKLTPRWQYGVWAVLALRMLIPVSTSRQVLGPFPIWMEAWKGAVEGRLSSAYAQPYRPISITSVLPVYRGMPSGVTDWLFVLYGVGVVCFLLRYLVRYLQLQTLLRKRKPASPRVIRAVHGVCRKYRLKPCRTVEVSGLPSTFISGIIRPVLAVPADREIDEKVLLHELLHLKYGDVFQSVFWCLLRSLHWFNPFLQYIAGRISNDMETLCDYRVLERLQGEERREYGKILLSMVNERYAEVPGTTSISNGGRNISRRIESIARFKQYSGGMAGVSVCIALVLAAAVLVGGKAECRSYCEPASAYELSVSMAMTRLNRCTTLAGALDTYAKGLISRNGILIAMASPGERQSSLEKELRENLSKNGELWSWNPGDIVADTKQIFGYQVYNLKKLEEGCYRGILVLSAAMVTEMPEAKEWCCILIPVEVRKEDGWVVEECGERSVIPGLAENVEMPPLRSVTAEGKNGSLTVETVSEYFIGQINQGDWGSSGTDGVPELLPDASFGRTVLWRTVSYRVNPESFPETDNLWISFAVAERESLEQEVVFPEKLIISVYDTPKSVMITRSFPVTEGAATLGYGEYEFERDAEGVSSPRAFKIRVYSEKKLIDEIWLEETENESR